MLEDIGQATPQPLMVFHPRDDQDKIGEWDVLPWLMRLATPSQGVAIDIGAGDSGGSSLPLLSEGHTVYMFESGYDNPDERDFVQLTIDINGWQDRTTLHGEVTGGSKSYIEQTFRNTARIELLKIDVDEMPMYQAVFKGIMPIVNRTDIIQIEMITTEIGVKGKMKIFNHFHALGFDLFGLEDVETFPGLGHSSVCSQCVDGDLESRSHLEAIEEGRDDYQYGQDSPVNLRLVPICKCKPHQNKLVGRGRASSNPLKCGTQFAFVRRDSETMETVAGLYGSCKSVCVDHPTAEL